MIGCSLELLGRPALLLQHFLMANLPLYPIDIFRDIQQFMRGFRIHPLLKQLLDPEPIRLVIFLESPAGPPRNLFETLLDLHG